MKKSVRRKTKSPLPTKTAEDGYTVLPPQFTVPSRVQPQQALIMPRYYNVYHTSQPTQIQKSFGALLRKCIHERSFIDLHRPPTLCEVSSKLLFLGHHILIAMYYTIRPMSCQAIFLMFKKIYSTLYPLYTKKLLHLYTA